ncbi:hypothetical protein [Labilithrix luteola]|nr:hypothetical protein [Labilithrix luteola]
MASTSVELALKQNYASGPLLPTRFGTTLGVLEKTSFGQGPRGTMRGQDLRLALTLSLDDDACVAFALDFARQGAVVTGTAHGPSAPLLRWALHALATALKCTLHDAELGEDVTPDADAHRAGAIAYLTAYESDVKASRKQHLLRRRSERAGDGAETSTEGAELLAWLAKEEHIALSDSADDLRALADQLPLEDPAGLYEMLIDTDAVDDVFVSEKELKSLVARFRARTTPQH